MPGVAPLPSGTVTFLFLDIERIHRAARADRSGLTELLESTETTEESSSGGGSIFGSEGDGRSLLSPRRSEAVSSAIDCQGFSGASHGAGAQVRGSNGHPHHLHATWRRLHRYRRASSCPDHVGGLGWPVLVSEDQVLITDTGIKCKELGLYAMKD